MTNESPQLENGYTRIANELLEAIALAGFSKREAAIVMSVLRNTYGRNGAKTAELSGSLLSEFTGMQANHARETTRSLIGKNVLTEAKGHYAKAIGINKNYGLWKLAKKIDLASPKTGLPVPKQDVPKQAPLVPKQDVKHPKTGLKTSQNRTKNVPKQAPYKERRYKKEESNINISCVRGVTVGENCPLSSEVAKEFIDYRATRKKPALDDGSFARICSTFSRVASELSVSADAVALQVIDSGWAGCKSGWLKKSDFSVTPASKHSGFETRDYHADLPDQSNIPGFLRDGGDS